MGNLLLHTTRHVFSEMCICGHHADSHHGNCIMRPEFIEKMQSCTYLGECEHYGVNEMWEECPMCLGSYIDKDDPLREEKLIEMIGQKPYPSQRAAILKMIDKGILRKEKLENIIPE